MRWIETGRPYVLQVLDRVNCSRNGVKEPYYIELIADIFKENQSLSVNELQVGLLCMFNKRMIQN